MNSYTDPLGHPVYAGNPQPTLPSSGYLDNMAPAATLPQPYSSVKDGMSFSLEIRQQPLRARMCGFGDKDRRPITPPPCVRLVIRDSNGREVDFSEVEGSYYVLLADLWDEHAHQEVNLVRHSSTTPSVSISLASTTRYPPTPEPAAPFGMPGVHPQYAARPVYNYQTGQHDYYNPQAPYQNYPGAAAMTPVAPRSPTEMYTRNLIGSNTVNAFRLSDTEGKVGYWFVLQDLSVRTEGTFRLKLNLFKIGTGENQLNQGPSQCLASVFSDSFQVWSAKKFPGVMDSTALSKTFASQGIKIPIRKDGGRGGGGDYDDDN